MNIEALGKKTGEIISVKFEHISIRLLDGTFIGPRIVQKDKGNITIHPDDKPLELNQEYVDLIINKGWNNRSDYSGVVNLMQQIKAANRINNPLDLIFDGQRIYPWDGHTRLICIYLLKQAGIVFSEVPARIYPNLNIRDAEYLRISKDGQVPHKPIDYARLIKKHIVEDQKKGINASKSRAIFLANTGMRGQQYDDFLSLTTLPIKFVKLIDQEIFSKTTVFNLLRRKDLSLEEKIKCLEVAYQTLEISQEKKVTGRVVENIAEDYTSRKTQELSQLDLASNQNIPESVATKQISQISEPRSISNSAVVATQNKLNNSKNSLDSETQVNSSSYTQIAQPQLDDSGSKPTIEPQVILPKATNKQLIAVTKNFRRNILEVKYKHVANNKGKEKTVAIITCDSEVYNEMIRLYDQGIIISNRSCSKN